MRVNPKVMFKVLQILNVENTGCSIKEDNKYLRLFVEEIVQNY